MSVRRNNGRGVSHAVRKLGRQGPPFIPSPGGPHRRPAHYMVCLFLAVLLRLGTAVHCDLRALFDDGPVLAFDRRGHRELALVLA